MTKGELIIKLNDYSDDLEIYYTAYVDGFDIVLPVEVVTQVDNEILLSER